MKKLVVSILFLITANRVLANHASHQDNISNSILDNLQTATLFIDTAVDTLSSSVGNSGEHPCRGRDARHCDFVGSDNTQSTRAAISNLVSANTEISRAKGKLISLGNASSFQFYCAVVNVGFDNINFIGFGNTPQECETMAKDKCRDAFQQKRFNFESDCNSKFKLAE